jgi:hypothetical protein
MKRYIIIFIYLTLGAGSVMASGIIEYKGQNYFSGMMTSFWAVDYALNGINEENEGFLEQNVIKGGKFYFVESLTENFDIEKRITRNGYIEHGEEIEIKGLTGVPFKIIKNERGESQIRYNDFQCIYEGRKILYNERDLDLSIVIIGYAANRRVIITEIILTEEEIERKKNEFREVD